MPLPDAARVELVRRYRLRLGRIVDGTTAVVQRRWDGLAGHDETDIATFEDLIATTLTVGRRTAVDLAAGFYSVLASKPAPSIDPARLGVTFDSLNPFTAYWHALKVGREPLDALAAGRSAAGAVTSRFLVSTSRRTGDQVLHAARVKVHGWERVPSPTACGWCTDVAGQTYSSAEAADFGHDRCDCTAVPAIG